MPFFWKLSFLQFLDNCLPIMLACQGQPRYYNFVKNFLLIEIPDEDDKCGPPPISIDIVSQPLEFENHNETNYENLIETEYENQNDTEYDYGIEYEYPNETEYEYSSQNETEYEYGTLESTLEEQNITEDCNCTTTDVTDDANEGKPNYLLCDDFKDIPFSLSGSLFFNLLDLFHKVVEFAQMVSVGIGLPWKAPNYDYD